jgi:hypothetical protein
MRALHSQRAAKADQIAGCADVLCGHRTAICGQDQKVNRLNRSGVHQKLDNSE